MYIIFEGIDGSGKTSLARCFAERLDLLNVTSICLREPSRGEYGIKVRERMRTGIEPWDPELHRLFVLDRKDHVARKIQPALELIRNAPSFALIQDRGYLSAPAYQAKNDGHVFEMLEEQRAITLGRTGLSSSTYRWKPRFRGLRCGANGPIYLNRKRSSTVFAVGTGRLLRLVSSRLHSLMGRSNSKLLWIVCCASQATVKYDTVIGARDEHSTSRRRNRTNLDRR